MAGRHLGIRSLVKAIARLSPAQVKKLLSSAPRNSENGEVARLKRERDKHMRAIQKLERKIARLTGGKGTPPTKHRYRRLSAETRRKMSEAAKRRYADKGKTEAPAVGKKLRTMSPETRAKMAAAAKARWAKVKGAVPSQS